MLRRSFVVLGLLVAGGALLGCAPHWRVVSEWAPNPFLGQRTFAVAPVDFAGLRIGSHTEEEYLAAKDSRQWESFAQDKAAFNAQFAEALVSRAHEAGIVVVFASGPADAPFLVRPSVGFIEPGFFALVVSEPSRVEMNVKITAPDGRVLDEVLMTHGTRGGFGIEASSGGRLRKDGAGLGAWVAEYLKRRAGVE